MAFHVNEVRLLGNLGKDAETQHTPSGVAVTKFSVATERSWKDKASDQWKKETQWTNVVAFSVHENIASQLVKGCKVHVSGRLQTRDYEKDGRKVYTTEVIADNVIPLGTRDSNGGGDSGGSYASQTSGSGFGGGARSSGGATGGRGFSRQPAAEQQIGPAWGDNQESLTTTYLSNAD